MATLIGQEWDIVSGGVARATVWVWASAVKRKKSVTLYRRNIVAQGDALVSVRFAVRTAGASALEVWV
jgi:hypothetical protein